METYAADAAASRHSIYCRFFPGFGNNFPYGSVRDLDDEQLSSFVRQQLVDALLKYRHEHAHTERRAQKVRQRRTFQANYAAGYEPLVDGLPHLLHPSAFALGLDEPGPPLTETFSPTGVRAKVSIAFARLGLQPESLCGGDSWIPSRRVFRLLRLLAWHGWLDRREYGGGASWHPWYDLVELWHGLWSPRFYLTAAPSEAVAIWASRSLQNGAPPGKLNPIFGVTREPPSGAKWGAVSVVDKLSPKPDIELGVNTDVSAFRTFASALVAKAEAYVQQSGDESLVGLGRCESINELIAVAQTYADHPDTPVKMNTASDSAQSPVTARVGDVALPAPTESAAGAPGEPLAEPDGPCGINDWRVKGKLIGANLSTQQANLAAILWLNRDSDVPFSELHGSDPKCPFTSSDPCTIMKGISRFNKTLKQLGIQYCVVANQGLKKAMLTERPAD